MSENQNEQVDVAKVELEAETYGALLDRLAELEQEAALKPLRRSNETYDVDELAEQGRRRSSQEDVTTPRTPTEVPNLDEMTNTQLAQFIVGVINEQGGTKIKSLETTVNKLMVMREIDKVESKYDDFWSYEDKIKDLAINTPGLSIEQAYKLAKAELGPRNDQAEGDRQRTRTEKLLKLPPRILSERPGQAASSSTNVHRGESLKTAAERAWEDVIGKGKAQIE